MYIYIYNMYLRKICYRKECWTYNFNSGGQKMPQYWPNDTTDGEIK